MSKWTRQADGSYARGDLTIRRFPGYPSYPLPVWELFRGGERVGGARSLAEVKEMGERMARQPRSAWQPGDEVLI